MVPQTAFSYWMHRNIRWVIISILVSALLMFILKKLLNKR